MILDRFSLQGKTALITGAGKGIGASICKVFAQMGADVICVSRNQADLDRVAEEARAFGVNAYTFSCDVTDEQQLNALQEYMTNEIGKLDILVNNAGAPGQGYGSLKSVDRRRFLDTIDINLTSTYTLTHLMLPLLQQSKAGNIVNVSSALSWMVDKRFAAYGAAKAGVNQMTKILSYELAPKIRVNAIAPGAIDTPSTAFIKQNPEMYKATVRWIPLQTMGDPEDIALGALYLASDASKFVSGKVLEIDGGMQALPGSAIEEKMQQAGKH
jgi:7-alpha-hydroxysteroid dehydrogenase